MYIIYTDTPRQWGAIFFAIFLFADRSNQMCQHLATKEGFKKVWNVEGGVNAYAKQVEPSVGVY